MSSTTPDFPIGWQIMSSLDTICTSVLYKNMVGNTCGK